MLSASALSPVIAAIKARLVTLASEDQVFFGKAPDGATEPYAVIASHTETQAEVGTDRDGTPSEPTVTVNVWDSDAADALTLYSSLVTSLTTTALSVSGFTGMRTLLDGTTALQDRNPDGSQSPKYGVSARFRFTLDAT